MAASDDDPLIGVWADAFRIVELTDGRRDGFVKVVYESRISGRKAEIYKGDDLLPTATGSVSFIVLEDEPLGARRRFAWNVTPDSVPLPAEGDPFSQYRSSAEGHARVLMGTVMSKDGTVSDELLFLAPATMTPTDMAAFKREAKGFNDERDRQLWMDTWSDGQSFTQRGVGSSGTGSEDQSLPRRRKRREIFGARMLLASSGRHNFADLELQLVRDSVEPEPVAQAKVGTQDCYHSVDLIPSDAQLITVSVMKYMLVRENAFRRSMTVQHLLDIIPTQGEAIYYLLQFQVAKEAGFKNPNLGVLAIRAAATLFPEDPAIHSIPMYRKFNRSCQGELTEGQLVPNMLLHRLDHRHLRDGSPLPSEPPLLLSRHARQLSNEQQGAGRRRLPLVVVTGSST